MRKRPRVIFNHHDGRGEQLAQVLQHYAQSAYPPGGSECAAISRETLLDYAAQACLGTLDISSRQLPIIKAAINWYFSEIEDDDAGKKNLLNAFQRCV